jgi:pilus assembly protein Flp/PilA
VVRKWLGRARNQSGQGMVEYALILVLVSIVVIVILLTMGQQIQNVFSNVVAALANCLGMGWAAFRPSVPRHLGSPVRRTLRGRCGVFPGDRGGKATAARVSDPWCQAERRLSLHGGR